MSNENGRMKERFDYSTREVELHCHNNEPLHVACVEIARMHACGQVTQAGACVLISQALNDYIHQFDAAIPVDFGEVDWQKVLESYEEDARA